VTMLGFQLSDSREKFEVARSDTQLLDEMNDFP